MNVSACLVTDGKHDMQPIIDSLPSEWEKVVWDNGTQEVWMSSKSGHWGFKNVSDLSVYGRYAAIEYAANDLILTQDDDVIVSDPEKLAYEWAALPGSQQDSVVCNMPPEFRPHYPDAALVGFGAVFHRDAPGRAFDRFFANGVGSYAEASQLKDFARECDRVFTCLTPRVLVDIPKTDREFASDPDRLWKQPGHGSSTQRMLELARTVRDA